MFLINIAMFEELVVYLASVSIVILLTYIMVKVSS